MDYAKETCKVPKNETIEEKVNVVSELRLTYPLKILLQISGLAKSLYYYTLAKTDKDVTDKEIVRACKLACLDEFINNLPDGYNTIVGEGGVTLSGGQRQRLTIARAFIQNTKIILFDEVTSALDNEIQGYIQQVINNMKDKYTILIIVHRLSTVINSDRIMLVEEGKISDVRTHKELLSNNKTYKKLYENEILDQ